MRIRRSGRRGLKAGLLETLPFQRWEERKYRAGALREVDERQRCSPEEAKNLPGTSEGAFC